MGVPHKPKHWMLVCGACMAQLPFEYVPSKTKWLLAREAREKANKRAHNLREMDRLMGLEPRSGATVMAGGINNE